MREGIENALNLIVSMAERSGNMNKYLKAIFETVSSLRNLFVQLKVSRDCKSHTRDLVVRVSTMKAELEACRRVYDNGTWRAIS